MAIPTDMTINVEIDGDVVDTIELSAVLSDIATIQNSGFCGMYNNQMINGGSYDTLLPDPQVVNRKTPLIWSGPGFPITLSAGDASGYTNPDGQYASVVWLYYIDGDGGQNSPDYCITENNINKFRIVTSWDAPKYVYYPEDPGGAMAPMAAYGYSSWNDAPTEYGVYSSQWGINFKRLEYWTDDEKTDYTQIMDIYPYQLFMAGGKAYLLGLLYGSATPTFCRADSQTINFSPYNGSFDRDDVYAYTVAFTGGTFDNGGSISANNLPYTISSYSHLFAGYTADKKYIGIVQTNSSSLPSGDGRLMLESYYLFHNRSDVYQFIANSGLKFYTDKLYKPVIENGVVTGYTDDMDTPSDLDRWEGSTDHGIGPAPPYPPGPSGGDEDNNDPINTTGAPFASGLCHYYALTAGSLLLKHISDALGTWDIENTHKDLYKNLVSCKLVKPPAPIPTSGSEPFTIYGVKPQYEGADITLPVVSGNPSASFGPYTIDRKFGDFRDYAPYTRVSIFLPYCGWCDLPSHVVGKSVSVKYFTDIIAATCKAVVFCGNNIIAEAAGVIGLDIPFVADNVGAKMQAVTAGMISALGGGIQLGAGIGTMVSTKSGNGAKAALSGASQYLSGYSQMAMAFNENTTEISGKNGDGCCISGATNIIIKIVRPKKGAYTSAPYVPPGYGHSIGFVSQKQVKVSSVSGLLIADNVDTSGISGATEAERAEIKRVLETGLIVNAAPE